MSAQPSSWPSDFFDRQDPSDDADFYASPRFVTHIDDGAIAAVSALYDELGVPDGRVLDLMSSWVSHLSWRPAGGLVVLGMNDAELRANPLAESTVLQDLNRDPQLPFADDTFDAVTCCVSVDYLVRPVEVLREAARVLRPGGLAVCTFSNRCFPSKAIRGWLLTDDDEHVAIVSEYLSQAGFVEVAGGLRTPASGGSGGRGYQGRGYRGDPLYGAWGRTPS